MSAGPVTSGVVIVQSDAAYTATPMPQLRISAYTLRRELLWL